MKGTEVDLGFCSLRYVFKYMDRAVWTWIKTGRK
jgi:hypothetical protein